MKPLLLLFTLFLLSGTAYTQPKNEISLGYGYGAKTTVVYGTHSRLLFNKSRLADSVVAARVLGTSKFVQFRTENISGVYALKYNRKMYKWLSVGVTTTIATLKANTVINQSFKSNGERIGTLSRTVFGISPEIVVSHQATKLVRIYGTAGLGVSLVFEKLSGDITGNKENRSSAFPNFQISPFGIKVGKKLCGYFEAGFGYKGVLNAGLSYGF